MKILCLFLFTFGLLFLLNELHAQRFILKLPKINPSRKTGPSGKPMQHFKDYPNRKSAEDAAKNAGKGNLVASRLF